MYRSFILAAAAATMLAGPAFAQKLDPQNTLYMDVKGGRVVIEYNSLDELEGILGRLRK